MKIKIERTKFQAALNTAKGVVTNSELAILSNVKIETTGDSTITFTATNLDQTISTSVDGQVLENGSITVPANLFSSMVGAMTEPIVEFKHEKNAPKAILTGGDLTYKIACIDASQFPVPANVNEAKSITFTQMELKNLLRKVSYAVSEDITRRTFVGVLFQADDGIVNSVATDGRRLACAVAKKEGTNAMEVIVPMVSIKCLQRLLGGEGDVVMKFDEGRAAVFATDAWTLQTKLVADKYPNWRAVVPNDLENSISIGRSDLIDAVKQVSLSADTSVKIGLKDGVMTLTASSADFSDAKAMLPVKYDGEEVQIIMNPRYITDVLGTMDNDDVKVSFNNGASPVKFTEDGSDNIAVVMPLRIN